jgi:hypothetical protein
MIGSDVVGKPSTIRAALKPYDELLRALPEEIRPRVAHDNFVELVTRMAGLRAAAGLGEKGIILPPDYEFSEKAHVRPRLRESRFMETRLARSTGAPG